MSEQQRVDIARAIAYKLLTLLADEPTGNWTFRGDFNLFEEFNRLGMTVLIATTTLI